MLLVKNILFKAINSGHCGVFEGQLLLGINVLESGLNHECPFMEATQDQFKLAWISIDISDSINARYICTVIYRI
jgi:hypothetical protein